MADPEHVDRLLQDVAEWNTWREVNRNIVPDLRAADLRDAIINGTNLNRARLHQAQLVGARLNEARLVGASLDQANLSQARAVGVRLDVSRLNGAQLDRTSFSRASLNGASLTGARLQEANLSDSSLIGTRFEAANLSGAQLNRATIRDANLDDANLTGANLTNAAFMHTSLRQANLSGATLAGTMFVNMDLSTVKGLDTCQHRGPSSLDSQTLVQSGALPLPFLRGCGLSDADIEYCRLYQTDLSADDITQIASRIAALTISDPLPRSTSLIYYGSRERDLGEKLHDHLQDRGLRTWHTPADPVWGRRAKVQLDQIAQAFDHLLILLSEHSMRAPWVEYLINRALDREIAENRRILFPIRLVSSQTLDQWDYGRTDSDRDAAMEVREHHSPVDFQGWTDTMTFDTSVGHLLKQLKAERCSK